VIDLPVTSAEEKCAEFVGSLPESDAFHVNSSPFSTIISLEVVDEGNTNLNKYQNVHEEDQSLINKSNEHEEDQSLINKSNEHEEDQSLINKSTEQPHCEVSDCLEEVFSACPFCLIFMCYNHMKVEYNSCIEHNKNFQVASKSVVMESEIAALKSNIILNRSPQVASKSVAVDSEVPAVNSDIILQTVTDNESEDTVIYTQDVNIVRKKKRVALRKRESVKKLRLSGDEYVNTYKAKDGGIKEVVTVKKSLGNRCQHKLKDSKTGRSFRCSEVTDECRQNEFRKFWDKKTWSERKVYVQALVSTREAVRRRKVAARSSAKSTKTELHDCMLRTADSSLVKVCKTFFLSTLGIGSDQFRRWTAPEEASKVGPQLIPKERPIRNADQRKILQAWLDSIPKVPSHYCRASTGKVYVDNTFKSLSDMHRIYCEHVDSMQSAQHPVSRRLFTEVLTETI